MRNARLAIESATRRAAQQQLEYKRYVGMPHTETCLNICTRCRIYRVIEEKQAKAATIIKRSMFDLRVLKLE